MVDPREKDYSKRGTVKQEPNGTWRYFINVQVDHKRLQRKRIGFATEQEARDGLNAVIKEIQEGTLVWDDPIKAGDWGLRDGGGDIRWKKRAACKGMDTNMFFPGRGESFKEAISVCNACPVKKNCLEWRMENCTVGSGMDSGIWGGTTGKQRDRLRGWKV